MKIKSFFAAFGGTGHPGGAPGAGPDAMLITSRRSSPEARNLGAYEVVFGLQSAAARPRPAAQAAPSADLSSELQNLRTQLQDIKSTLQGARSADRAAPEAEELFSRLVSLDLARAVARDMVASAVRLRDQRAIDQPSISLPLQAHAAEAISNRLRFAPPVATGHAGIRASARSSSPVPPARAKPLR